MNDGFKKVEVADPSKLKTFIEGTSGSVLAILSVKYFLTLLKVFKVFFVFRV